MAPFTEILTCRPVRLELEGVVLNGDLAVPMNARGLVLFAHGSGSSRHSPRNRAVADALQRGRLGTLLLDLLTQQEERADATTAEFRFDIPLLADRLVGAIDWVRAHPQTSALSRWSVRSQHWSGGCPSRRGATPGRDPGGGFRAAVGRISQKTRSTANSLTHVRSLRGATSSGVARLSPRLAPVRRPRQLSHTRCWR